MTDKPLSAGQVFAARVREIRGARGWSQRKLSDELDKAGWTMAQSTIAKIESGSTRARNVSLEDAMAICAALGVSPIDCLISREATEIIAVTPAIVRPAPWVRAWWRGYSFLREDDDRQFFFSQAPVGEMVARIEAGRRARETHEPHGIAEFHAANAADDRAIDGAPVMEEGE